MTLWLEYLKFVEEHDATVANGTKDGIVKMRNLYEKALAAVGLHYLEGGKVWEAYREFEQALLMMIDASGGEVFTCKPKHSSAILTCLTNSGRLINPGRCCCSSQSMC